SALLTRGLPPTPPPAGAEHEGLFAAAIEGGRFVWGNKLVRTLTIAICLLLCFIAVDNVALVFLTRETLGGSAFAYGLIEALFGAGMLLGSFWILRGGGGRWAAPRLFVFSCGLSTLGSFGGGVAPDLAVLGV